MALNLPVWINTIFTASLAGELDVPNLRGAMPGRKKLPDHLLKYPRKGVNKGLRNPYNKKTVEPRGMTTKEPILIKSFWQNHTMDNVTEMTDEELSQAIEKFLKEYISRQIRQDKDWDFPIKSEYLKVLPYNEPNDRI